MPPPTTAVSRKRTRSTNISERNNDQQPSTSTIVSSLPTNPAPPKRQRNNPPPVETRTNHSRQNQLIIPDSQPSQRYNLRPRRPQSHNRPPEVSTPRPTTVSRRARRQTPSTITSITNSQQEQPAPAVIQPRQYRLVYISDDDDQPTTTQSSTTIVNSTFNLVPDDDDDAPVPSRRTARPTSHTNRNTRSRTTTDPASTTTASTSADNQDFPHGRVAHVRLNRAIEIVIDSIQSLEGAVSNFDQLVFSLIYGRLNTRTEFESIEGMIRLSRILNLNFPARLTQDEIDALPQIKFLNKSDSPSSILLAEKCPICITEFTDQEIINKLHCTHLFHLQCISTWLHENDSCPTCRRKVNAN